MFEAVSTFDVNKIRNEFPVLNQVVNGKPLTYLDNAATAFPKPPVVIDTMAAFYRDYGVNPGRAGYDLAVEAGLMLDGARATC